MKIKPGGSAAWTRWLTALLVLLGVGWAMIQLRAIGLVAIAEELQRADPRWVALALVALVSRTALAAWRLAAITRRTVPCRTLPFLPITLCGYAVAMITPGVRVAALLLRSLLASRLFGGGIATHIAPNLLEQLLLAASWAIVFAAHLPGHLAATGDGSAGSAVSFALGVPLLTALTLFALHRAGDRLGRWLARPRSGLRGRLGGSAADTIEVSRRLARDPRALTSGLAGGVGFVLLSGLLQWSALTACGARPTWTSALFSVVFSGAAGIVIATPAGVGVAEAVEIAYLRSQGLPADAAAAGVLLARGIFYLFSLGGGGAALYWAWRRGLSTSVS